MKIVLLLSFFVGVSMLGCLFPRMEPLPTYTPAPVQQIVVTPTPIPESEWVCLKGKIEINSSRGPYGGNNFSFIVGEQILCGRDWKISNLYGPVGSLENDPDKPLTFGDLKNSMENKSD